jgi:hypothetical protein
MSDTPEKQLKIDRKQDRPPYFSDFANVTSGTYGVKISFGNIIDNTEKEMTVEEFLTIGMSAEHARILVNVLVKNLRQYEKMVGEIRVSEKFGEEQPNGEAGQAQEDSE